MFGSDNIEFTAKAEWWFVPEGRDPSDEDVQKERASSLFDTVRGLEDSQRSAHEQNLWNARLYSNRELVHFDWGHGTFYNTSLQPISLLGENLVLSVVETLVSRVGKHRARIKAMAMGASFKLQRLARRLERWIGGEFVRNQVYEKTTRMFRDALIFGFGCMKVEEQDGKLCLRRVFPDDFIVDQTEAAYTDGALPHVYERRCMRIEEVEHKYGLKKGTLGARQRSDYLSYRSPGKGWCIVVEAYRLGPNGRHYVCADGVELLDEEWNEDWTPYVWYHYNDPVSGFYWPSVVEQTLPFQVRLNEINEVIRDAQDLMARPRILVSEGSRVNPQDIDNLTGRIIKYTGIKPEALVWDAVSGELYEERERQIRACFEQFGLMPLVSQGKLPDQARMDSAAAFQEATNISDDRQADPMARYEDFHLKLARTMIRVMCAKGLDYETVWYSGGRKARAESIRWSDVDIDENAYTLQLGAASIFSLTPAARTDKVEGWFQKALIDTEQYWDLTENPDIESHVSLQRAASDDIARVIELLEDGKYESPTPAQDLVLGVEKVSLAYLRLGNYDDVPVKVKQNFIKWIAMARAVLRQGTQTPDAQGLGNVPAEGPFGASGSAQAMPAMPEMMMPQMQGAMMAMQPPGMMPGGPMPGPGMMPPGPQMVGP